MLTTIRILKPSFVVGENVAGLVSMENGKTLERIFFDLEDEGYTAESFIIPACGVGAWHRRDRIWIIAYNTSKGFQNWRGTQMEQSLKKPKFKRQNCKYRGLQDVPDTECGGQSGQGEFEQSSNTKKTEGGETTKSFNGCRSDQWAVEPELGGMVARFSDWMDGYWNKEPNIPRVATGIKDRVNRLKALGNAIVPQITLEIFKAIDETFNTRKQT